MIMKDNKFNIKIKGLNSIPVINTSATKKTNILKNYGILIEFRHHKVKTDENKLFGTKANHKYF